MTFFGCPICGNANICGHRCSKRTIQQIDEENEREEESAESGDEEEPSYGERLERGFNGRTGD